MVDYASDATLDIHRDMAAECYLLPKEQVTKATRGIAKNKFVFPVLYGSWWKNIGRHLWEFIGRTDLKTVDGVCLYKHLKTKGIHNLDQYLSHVQKVEESFGKRFSHWSSEKDVWWNDYQRKGEFPLKTGFVCRGVYSINNLMNYPIQGPSFHMLLWSLIQMVKWLKQYKMKSVVMGQIHDSIFMDVHRSELQEVMNRLEKVMTVDVRKNWDWIVTPLEVEIELSADNWYEKTEWTRQNGTWGPA